MKITETEFFRQITRLRGRFGNKYFSNKKLDEIYPIFKNKNLSDLESAISHLIDNRYQKSPNEGDILRAMPRASFEAKFIHPKAVLNKDESITIHNYKDVNYRVYKDGIRYTIRPLENLSVRSVFTIKCSGEFKISDYV